MKRLELAMTSLLTAAALVIVTLLVARTFGGQTTIDREDRRTVRPVNPAGAWRELIRVGRPITDSTASRSVIVLSDFECPACRAFHEVVRDAHRRLGDSLHVRYVHFPLSRHRFALPTARMAECAAEKGSFGVAVDRIFGRQDSLGLVPRERLLAPASSEPMDPHLVDCAAAVTDTATFLRVAVGQGIARKIGARGTPTIIVDGMILAFTPTAEELQLLVRRGMDAYPITH